MTKGIQKHTSLPARRILRRMGYLKDQQGIVRRYLREVENWDPHLERCRDFIRETVNRFRCKSPGFLGSGWLLDIPLEELSKTCERIILVDISHPPQVIHRVEKVNTVTLVEADITGGWIEFAYRMGHSRGKSAGMTEKRPGGGIDLTVWPADHWFSVNILDQLNALVVDYLGKFRRYDDAMLKEMAMEIQSQHLASLTRAGGSVISGTREILLHEGKTHKTNPLLLARLPAGTGRRTWTWKFDTQGEYHPGFDTHFEVVAMNITPGCTKAKGSGDIQGQQ